MKDLELPRGAQIENLSQSLVRGLAILSTFTANRPEMGISDLASVLDLNKSTVQRYVNTLKILGYLLQDPRTSKYRLGVKVLDLGLSALEGMELRKIALPFLEDLASRHGYTVNMAILDGVDIVYIERVRTNRIFDIDLHVGSRLPAYCASMGKILLAHLPQAELEARLSEISFKKQGPKTIVNRARFLEELERIRHQGFAMNDEELAYGLRSIAAPVRSHDRAVHAAINLAVHTSMITLNEMIGSLVPSLLHTANEISKRLGYRESGSPGTTSSGHD